jgi:hypothetical protein
LDASPDDPRLNRLETVLALPKTTKVQKLDIDRTEEFRWLAQHRNDYTSQWVAVQGKELVAHARSLKELRRMLRGREFEIAPLVHRLD